MPRGVTADRTGNSEDHGCKTDRELDLVPSKPDHDVQPALQAGGQLEATVGLYNRHAARGEDPLFHKDARWLHPLQAPFGAYRIGGLTSGFTLGGLRTTVNAEVLHVGGGPIPGLYAAGRTSSGIPAWGYASGASLGDAAFFGRKAGRAAARS